MEIRILPEGLEKMIDIAIVAFDYNGTITDDAQVGFKSSNHMLTHYGLPEISFEQFQKTITLPWADFYVANGVRKEDIDPVTHQKMYSEVHSSYLDGNLRLKDYVKETLTYLKDNGLSLAILSSRNSHDLLSELDALDVIGFFDAIIGSESIVKDGMSADKNVYALIANLGISVPASVLYIGDLASDIALAKNQGFYAGAITDGWQSREVLLAQEPHFVFDAFLQIKDLFSGNLVKIIE